MCCECDTNIKLLSEYYLVFTKLLIEYLCNTLFDSKLLIEYLCNTLFDLKLLIEYSL
jgi:hypothetical protein